MKAYLRSARIAPKKANVIAKMVRGMPANDAMTALKRTNKKGARMVEQLVRSALANATHNDKQDASKLVIKTIVVNQALGYRRGIPKARGSVRPVTKFLSHIALTLGVAGEIAKTEPKAAKKASQPAKNRVKKSPSTKKAEGSESSSDTSVSS